MNMNDSTSIATGVTQGRLAGLRKWNLGLTLLHFAQSAVGCERGAAAQQAGRDGPSQEPALAIERD